MKNKAAFLVEPGRVELMNCKFPEMREGDLLIEMDYVGICGSDLHFYQHGRIGRRVVVRASDKRQRQHGRRDPPQHFRLHIQNPFFVRFVPNGPKITIIRASPRYRSDSPDFSYPRPGRADGDQRGPAFRQSGQTRWPDPPAADSRPNGRTENRPEPPTGTVRYPNATGAHTPDGILQAPGAVPERSRRTRDTIG